MKQFRSLAGVLAAGVLVASQPWGQQHVLSGTPCPQEQSRPLAERTKAAFRYPEATCGQGQLRYIGGLPVLSVRGTPEQIGQQVALLAAKPAERLLGYPKDALKHFGVEASFPVLVQVGNSMLPRFPPDHRKELEAMIEASGVDRDLLVMVNTIDDIERLVRCSSLIVQARRSATGGPMLGRNLDFETLGYLQQYSLVTVYHPKGKHALASVGLPGLVGVLSGINDVGLSLTTHDVTSSADGSPRFDPLGTPLTLCFRRILEECTTVKEAEKLLRSVKPTTYMNLAVCDRKQAAVLEITPKTVAARYPEEGVLACTNHFRTGKLATWTDCRRYQVLAKSGQMEKLGLDDVAKQLHAVNQGRLTFQTMIFEPAAPRLHLAFGSLPSSSQRPKPLELGPLFK